MIRLHMLSMSRERWDVYIETASLTGMRLVVANSKNPECEASRELLAWGVLGKATTFRNGTPAMSFDVEEMAGLTVRENEKGGPKIVKHVPFPVAVTGE